MGYGGKGPLLVTMVVTRSRRSFYKESNGKYIYNGGRIGDSTKFLESTTKTKGQVCRALMLGFSAYLW